MRPTMNIIRSVFSAAAIVAMVGCGAATPTASVSSPPPTSAYRGTSPAGSPATDLDAARSAALKIIVALPGTPGVWGGCSQLASNFADCPFAPVVIDRLNSLASTGYFGDAPPSGVCAEDYVTGTQNGLFVAPEVFSVTAAANGSVAVVIKRGPPPPDFTATMTLESGLWLATDLASGTGQAASIFSAKPNC